MKQDLDGLMLENNIDALLIMGGPSQNPNMYYFTGGADLTYADVIKVRGKEPVIFHSVIERENAARTGMPTISYSRYPEKELLAQANNNITQVQVLKYRHMLEDLGVASGRISLYGRVDINKLLPVITELIELESGYEVVSGLDNDILEKARATKDSSEISRIKAVGEVTAAVVNQAADFLSGHSVKDNLLIKSDGFPLTIGDVKTKINSWLMERGVETPEETIFAMGRDAGVPHNKGENKQPLQVGIPIVFDIFPCEAGGGYFYDMTRTWCLGYAPDNVLEIYHQVMSVYESVRSQLRLNDPFSNSQVLTCELFEKLGHPTIRQQPGLEQGYVHSIGHGVGLNVHEKPFARQVTRDIDTFQSGMVFTLEPGLYYPDENLGVRIEDTLWIDDNGNFNVMAECPKDLVIPVKS